LNGDLEYNKNTNMKYALITTFDVEQPYSFRQVVTEKPLGDFNGVIWVELDDDSNITPRTHKYNGTGFEELPPLSAQTTYVSSNSATPTVI
jgi:hypothetical protein